MSLTNRSRQYRRPQRPPTGNVDDSLARMQDAIDHIVHRLREDFRALEQRVAEVEQRTTPREPPP